MTDQAVSKTKTARIQALPVFLSVSSATVIVLALLGYGQAASVEARLGMPHAMLFNFTSDLLTLGGSAVVGMLNHLEALQQWRFYLDFWAKFLPIGKATFLASVVVIVLATLCVMVQRWVSHWGKIKTVQAWHRNAVTKHPWLVRVVAAPVILPLGVMVGWPLATLAMVIGVAAIGLVLSIVPLLGYLAGTGHIDDWVVGPEICVPVKSRAARLKPKDVKPADTDSLRPRAANCVAVKREDGAEVRGRVVFSTFNTVVLFDPHTGTVQRVSTDGATVEVIGELLPPSVAGKSPDSS